MQKANIHFHESNHRHTELRGTFCRSCLRSSKFSFEYLPPKVFQTFQTDATHPKSYKNPKIAVYSRIEDQGR